MQSLPLSFYTDQISHTPLKVSLFSRIHEAQQVIEQLEKITQLSPKLQNDWLDEHEPFLRDLLEKYTQQSPLEFEEMEMDTEMMSLVKEYTTSSTQMMTTIQYLFSSREKIKG
jgi:hypothetical protein